MKHLTLDEVRKREAEGHRRRRRLKLVREAAKDVEHERNELAHSLVALVSYATGTKDKEIKDIDWTKFAEKANKVVYRINKLRARQRLDELEKEIEQATKR